MRATEAIKGQSVVDAEPAAAATADVSSSISVVDVEVVSAIRCDHLLGRLDAASAAQAVGTCGTGPASGTPTSRC